jgi:SAM-dependent methyltransferase
MADKETLSVYAAKAADYARLVASDTPGKALQAFIAALPDQSHVLDLGCGVGDAACHMIAAGHSVDAWDASPEMAALARRRGVEVQIRTFDDLDTTAEYDGVHANFSLLHAPKSDFPAHLGRIARALKPGGLFHFGTKLGEGERRDALGRFYAFYDEAELEDLFAAAGLEILNRYKGKEAGLAGAIEPFIILLART